MKRYSDEIPYEQRRYWYFTLHGIGPGMIPKDLKILEIREGLNDKGTFGDYICLDGILTSEELREYDLKELIPPGESKSEEEIILEYFREKSFHGIIDVWKENNEIHISIEWGDWKHQHLFCTHLMKDIGYEEVSEEITEEDGSDCYSSEHVYTKN